MKEREREREREREIERERERETNPSTNNVLSHRVTTLYPQITGKIAHFNVITSFCLVTIKLHCVAEVYDFLTEIYSYI